MTELDLQHLNRVLNRQRAERGEDHEATKMLDACFQEILQLRRDRQRLEASWVRLKTRLDLSRDQATARDALTIEEWETLRDNIALNDFEISEHADTGLQKSLAAQLPAVDKATAVIYDKIWANQARELVATMGRHIRGLLVREGWTPPALPNFISLEDLTDPETCRVADLLMACVTAQLPIGTHVVLLLSSGEENSSGHWCGNITVERAVNWMADIVKTHRPECEL